MLQTRLRAQEVVILWFQSLLAQALLIVILLALVVEEPESPNRLALLKQPTVELYPPLIVDPVLCKLQVPLLYVQPSTDQHPDR